MVIWSIDIQTRINPTNQNYSHIMSSTPPGGQRTLQKRRQAQAAKDNKAKQTPTSTRSAGFGGSSNSILKIFTDEANGLRVDPLVVLFLAVGFIFSVVALHVISKVTGRIF